jgi:hypothetical protein
MFNLSYTISRDLEGKTGGFCFEEGKPCFMKKLDGVLKLSGV